MANAKPSGSTARSIVLTEVEAMGGAERSCFALSRWLYEQKLPHQFLTYRDDAGLAAHASHPITVVQLVPDLLATTGAREKISALRRYFAENPPERKPLTSGYQPAMHATLAGLRGFHNLMHDTPALFSQPEHVPGWKDRLRRALSDRITAYGLRSGGNTIVTSEFLQADTLRTFGIHAEIARMGGLASPNDFHLRPVTSQLRLFTVSRLEANKRVDWILRSLAALEISDTPLSSRVDWHLDISGKGSLTESLTAMSTSLGIASRVHFHGYVGDERLQQLYDQAHLFLMPAVQGYGIPAIEALQRGIPVLLHRESGVSDILLDTPWAFVFENGEESMLPAMHRAVDAVLRGDPLHHPLPNLPTENQWAERVASLCGWL